MTDKGKLTVGVPRETFPRERRVALTPQVLPSLHKTGLHILIEKDAGSAAGFPDEAYQEKGATVVSRKEVFLADVIVQVRLLGTNPQEGRADLDLLRAGQILIGISNPLAAPGAARALAGHQVTLFDMEMIPRITRAQSMDVLSSQANIAGYKAVLLAAVALPKMFPMMTTAAGTIPPAKVLVLGAGVAGLQAIATAKRLGAVVEAFDVRPEVKEQVLSLGAKFVEVELDTTESRGAGGYAKEQSEEFLRKQRELLSRVVAANDVVITTAQVPGKKAPILVTDEMVQGMAPGSVIIDLAAQQGGNVEPSKPGEPVVKYGVTILGPTNVPASVPFHSSQMYAKNVSAFLLLLLKNGKLNLDMEDQIIRDTLIARGGEVTNPRVREALGLAPLASDEILKLFAPTADEVAVSAVKE